MKIVFVSNNYLPFVGGVETHIRQVSEKLSERHKVSIAAVNFQQNRKISRRLLLFQNDLLAISSSGRWDGGVEILSLAPRAQQKFALSPLFMRAIPLIQRKFYHQIHRLTHAAYRFSMRNCVERAISDADVVHCMCFGDLGWLTVQICNDMDIPVVLTPFVHPGQWGDGPNDVDSYKQADALIGLVKTDCEYLERLGVPRIKIHEVGVSPDLKCMMDGVAFRGRYSIESNPMILYVGRMMRQKGAVALMQAAKRVWEQHPSAVFVFAGPGSEQEVSIFKNCDSRVMYLGKISAEEKAEALAACTFFCMPSTSEILPTVYLEAWSLGKAVIGGTAHGLSELVEGNSAGRVVSQDPAELASVICDALADPDKCSAWGENGRKLVEREYSTQVVARKLESIYEGVQA